MTDPLDRELEEIISSLLASYGRYMLDTRSLDPFELEAEAKSKLKSLLAKRERKAQHLHRFDDETYRCIYCGLNTKELHEQTAELTRLEEEDD